MAIEHRPFIDDLPMNNVGVLEGIDICHDVSVSMLQHIWYNTIWLIYCNMIWDGIMKFKLIQHNLDQFPVQWKNNVPQLQCNIQNREYDNANTGYESWKEMYIVKLQMHVLSKWLGLRHICILCIVICTAIVSSLCFW